MARMESYNDRDNALPHPPPIPSYLLPSQNINPVSRQPSRQATALIIINNIFFLGLLKVQPNRYKES